MAPPLNLPDGSVRAILALGLTGVTIFLWGTQAPVPPELLATTGLVVGNYFGSRGSAAASTAVAAMAADQVVAPPFIPGEDNA